MVLPCLLLYGMALAAPGSDNPATSSPPPSPRASAVEYYLETPPTTNREDASRQAASASSSGYAARVVRRFRLGRGWEYVVLVEQLATEPAALSASATLATHLGVPMTVYAVEERGHNTAATATVAAAEQPAFTAAQWLAQADVALGGAAGGANELARAPAVHFVFNRTVRLGGKDVTFRHDYWREGGYRRLAVQTNGAGMDSVAVVTPTGAWITTNNSPTTRDIGVLVTTLDEFAPEAVLPIALDGHRLLVSPDAQRFQVLEGAESGIRLGIGAEGVDRGLTFIDIDPASGHLLHARYVTEGGPIEWELKDWKDLGAGVVVPYDVRVVRADSSTERIHVEHLEQAAKAPEGIFKSPTARP